MKLRCSTSNFKKLLQDVHAVQCQKRTILNFRKSIEIHVDKHILGTSKFSKNVAKILAIFGGFLAKVTTVT